MTKEKATEIQQALRELLRNRGLAVTANEYTFDTSEWYVEVFQTIWPYNYIDTAACATVAEYTKGLGMHYYDCIVAIQHPSGEYVPSIRIASHFSMNK